MDVAPVYQTVSFATKDEWNTSDNDSLTMTADENDFYQRVVSSDDENYLDSDNGSVTDLDGSTLEGAYCVVSDDGSAEDLNMDMLDAVDYGGSVIWILGPLRMLVAAVQKWMWRMILILIGCPLWIVTCTYMVNVYAYCALLARRIYVFYGTGP